MIAYGDCHFGFGPGNRAGFLEPKLSRPELLETEMLFLAKPFSVDGAASSSASKGNKMRRPLPPG
jgi:hypothetical protein